ncbi:MAG: sepF2, partial [Blastococcus sp.]|nr:sepF2 [Blastococcus sp.]
MAGAMRRMGIYLGLVEDDDARGYGRYDARQSDHVDRDRRYGRYADDHYDDRYADGDYPPGDYVDEDLESAELAPVRGPEPLPVRRVA